MNQRGNEKAARLIDKTGDRYLSIQSYMELLQGPKNKLQHKNVRDFMSDFSVLPLSENTGHRALIYQEECALSSNMRAGDAIIAATAIENNLPPVSSNAKHFKAVKELQLNVFTPGNHQ